MKMRKGLILRKAYFVLISFMSFLKRHILLLCQLIVAVCGLIFCLNILNIWYRVPNKSVTFTTQVLGCIGKPESKIKVVMNYGDKELNRDSIGFFIDILHLFRNNSPHLFKGDVFIENKTRTKRCIEEYEPLCKRYCSSIDSISTLYKNIITLESNLYNEVKAKDNECWSNLREVVIWQQPTIIKNKNVTENETWFYVKRLLRTWNPPVDSVCLKHKLLNPYDNDLPYWYSKGDVSKLNFELKIKDNDLIDCKEIIVCFNGPYCLSSITIEPDEAGYNYIRFTNPFKLEVISKKGLVFYSSFPELERMQQIRIAILLIIIPILLSWIIFLLKRITFNQGRHK